MTPTMATMITIVFTRMDMTAPFPAGVKAVFPRQYVTIMKYLKFLYSV
jgi:hypothetical protein